MIRVLRTDKRWGCQMKKMLGALGISIVALLVAGSIALHYDTATPAAAARPNAAPASARAAALATPTARPTAHIGESIVARGTWICGSSPEALDEMTKWAVRGDKQEMVRVLLRTGSAIWEEGAWAKVLDFGGFMMVGRAKIRIVKREVECWVPFEAATR
jgi:hypothetical protein